jgi:tetratricopeptide (TPR) repeat protein
MSDHRQRAELLLQQSRFDLAEKELRQALLANPNDAHAHALLGMTLSELERFEEATSEAKTAVHLQPDVDMSHFALAQVMFKRDRYSEALAAVQEAIRINPFDPHSHGLLAGIRYCQRRWKDALAAAEAGLEIEPDNVACVNYRAMAQVKLGRREQAGNTLEASLAKDPDNAVTHASQGWALLHAGQPKRAMQHFQESLRLDPTFEFARAGIVEALKAHNPIYRWLLAYFLWMSRLSRGAQWAVVLGVYFGGNIARRLARTYPEWSPLFWSLFFLILGFAMLTWVAKPLFNLLLRLSKLGRLALSRDEIKGSNWVGGFLAIGLLTLFIGIVLDFFPLIVGGGVLLISLISISATFLCQPGWPRLLMATYTTALVAAGIVSAAMANANPEVGVKFFVAFLLGNFVGSLLGNILVNVTPKH